MTQPYSFFESSQGFLSSLKVSKDKKVKAPSSLQVSHRALNMKQIFNENQQRTSVNKTPIYLDDILQKQGPIKAPNNEEFFLTSSQLDVFPEIKDLNLDQPKLALPLTHLPDSGLRYKHIAKSPQISDRFPTYQRGSKNQDDEDRLSRFGVMKRTLMRLSTNG